MKWFNLQLIDSCVFPPNATDKRRNKRGKKTKIRYSIVYLMMVTIYIQMQAWEPSVAQSTHTTQNLKTKLRTFPWFSRGPQSKFEANRSRGFLSYDRTNIQTNKQTNRQTEIITLYKQILYREVKGILLYQEFPRPICL